MFVIAKKDIGKFKKGGKYKIKKELPFDYIVDLGDKDKSICYMSKEPMESETDNFIFTSK